MSTTQVTEVNPVFNAARQVDPLGQAGSFDAIDIESGGMFGDTAGLTGSGFTLYSFAGGTLSLNDGVLSVGGDVGAGAEASVYTPILCPTLFGMTNLAWMSLKLNNTGIAGNRRVFGAAFDTTLMVGAAPTDGLWFELNGTTLSVVSRVGSVDTSVASGAWNGTPFTLDTNFHIYKIYYTTEQAWFVIDGILRHTMSFANGIAESSSFFLLLLSQNTAPVASDCQIQARGAALTHLGVLSRGSTSRPVNINPIPGASIAVTTVQTFPVEGLKGNGSVAPGTTNLGVVPGVANAGDPAFVEGRQVALSTTLAGYLRSFIIGGKTSNGAAPGADNVGVLPVVATAADPAITEGRLAALSATLAGYLRSLIIGTLTNNGAAPAATNVGVLPAVANAANPSFTEGRQGLLSMDTSGQLRVRGVLGVTGAKTTNNAAPGSDNVGSLSGLTVAAAPSLTTGFLQALSMDLAGNLRVRNQSTTPSQTSAASDSAAAVQILAANTARLGATLYNDSTSICYVKLGATASTTSYSIILAAGAAAAVAAAYYTIPAGYTGIVSAIWASTNGSMRVCELT